MASESTPLKEMAPNSSNLADAGSDGDDLNAPLTKTEIIRTFGGILTITWVVYVPMFLFGAFFYSFPELPKPWFGFWLTTITTQIGCIAFFPVLLARPRVFRERMRKKTTDASDSPEERMFHKMLFPTMLFAILLSCWEGQKHSYNNGTNDDDDDDDAFPQWLGFTGASMMAIGLLIIMFVMKQNSFLSAVVYEQKGHELVTTGLYGVVRHPMYMGTFIYFVGFPLAMGSYWGLLPFAFCSWLLFYRTWNEEKFLVKQFGDEYLAYAQNTKYRMIPFVV